MASSDNARLAEEEYELGLSAAEFSDGHLFEVAIKHLQNAIQLQPGMVPAWIELARANRYLKRYDDAFTAHKEAIRLATERLEQAKSMHSDTNDAAKELAGAWGQFGATLTSASRHDEAIRAFQEAVGFNPEYWVPWASLGDEYKTTGRYEDAIRAFREVVRLHGYDSLYAIDLAICLDKAGRAAEAEEVRKRHWELRRQQP